MAGKARCGKVRQGRIWFVMAGAARRAWVSSVKARYGMAGKVCLGVARCGLLWQAWKAKNRKELFFMVYEWKDLASVRNIKADAQVAGEVCEELEREGRLTPENLVEVSKDENAPLHNEFEWNDATAAKKYRRSQAQFIIQMLVVKSSDDEEEEKKPPVRAFFAIDRERRSYESVVSILESKDKTATLREQVVKELACFYGKYQAIFDGDLAKLGEEIRNVITPD